MVSAPGDAGANYLHVARAAAADGSGLGLEIVLEDPPTLPASDAWLAIGPESGLRAEAALRASFVIDPRALESRTASREAGTPRGRRGAVIPFLRLYSGSLDTAPVLVVFLRAEPAGAWSLGALAWDPRSEGFAVVGSAALITACDVAPDEPGCPALPFDPEDPAHPARPHVEMEWSSGDGVTPGSLRILRSVSRNTSPVELLSATLVRERNTVDFVQLGVHAGEYGEGLRGALRLDDFRLARVESEAPSSTPQLPEPTRQR